MEKKVDRHLPGYSTDLDEAVAESQEIVEGTLLSIGNPDPGAPGQIYYSDASVRVNRWLKGHTSESHAADLLKLAYTVQKVPANVAEDSLENNEIYLFFLVANDKRMPRAIKIMASNHEIVDRVNKLLHK